MGCDIIVYMNSNMVSEKCDKCDASIIVPVDVPHAGMFYSLICGACEDEDATDVEDEDEDTYDDGCPLCGRKGFCSGYCT